MATKFVKFLNVKKLVTLFDLPGKIEKLEINVQISKLYKVQLWIKLVWEAMKNYDAVIHLATYLSQRTEKINQDVSR